MKLLSRIPKRYRDLLARAGWTLLEAALGVVATVVVPGLPVEVAPVIAVALSMAKSYIATKVGNKDDATFSKAA